MTNQIRHGRSEGEGAEGFSLIEMLVSVAIITVLMAIVFQFLSINQRRYRSQQLMANVTQGGRGAFEVLSQELNQAGYNPPFINNIGVGNSPPSSTGALVNVPVTASVAGHNATWRVFYGSRLVIGDACATGTAVNCDQEEVLVNADPTYVPSSTPGSAAITTTTIPIVMTNNHSAGEPVYSRNYPYPNGVLYDNRITVLTATISTATRTSNVATISTTGAHNFVVGGLVQIAGVSDTTFNGGPFQITSIPSSTSFTFSQTAANSTGTGGTATESAPQLAVADTKLLFFGDLQDSGDMWYAEYRIRYKNSSGGWSDACDGTTAGSTPPFTLTRFITKLSKGGAFYIPVSLSQASSNDDVYVAESPLVSNILGTCANVNTTTGAIGLGTSPTTTWSAPDGTPVFAAVSAWSGNTPSSYVTPLLNSDGAPLIWYKSNTFGACYTGTTPCTPFYQTFVRDVQVALTVQEAQRDVEVGAYANPTGAPQRTQRLETHITPRNTNDALTLAQNGASGVLPGIPIDPTHDCTLNVTYNIMTCPSLPIGTLR